jgi:hypothetical protein
VRHVDAPGYGPCACGAPDCRYCGPRQGYPWPQKLCLDCELIMSEAYPDDVCDDCRAARRAKELADIERAYNRHEWVASRGKR